MKKRILALVLALAMTAGPLSALAHTDPPDSELPADHWAYEAVTGLTAAGIIGGEEVFDPDGAVTPGMFLTMVGRLVFPALTAKDGEPRHAPYVTAARLAGWLDGIQLDPEGDSLTRYDMAAVAVKVAEGFGLTAPEADAAAVSDYNEIPDEYKTAVKTAYALGLLCGKDGGRFFGSDSVTGAEAAMVVWRLKGAQEKQLLYILFNQPSVPAHYTATTPTDGALEAKYMAMGSHEVHYMESAAMMSFQKYEIYYPADMADMTGPLPAVVFVNGTGVKGSKYPALQRHMASWGFITIATEEEYAWNGFSAEMCVRYLELMNVYDGEVDGKANPFKGKVDLDNVGVTGHSQGGIGVINAITDQRHAETYKAAVALSATQTLMAAALQWDFDVSKVATPILMMAGTGPTDTAIAPLESLEAGYESISDDVTKVLARRSDADHGEMLYYGDGYVTAWFMYYLQGDTEAGKAFFGDGAEILTNPLYQDVRVDP